MLFHSALWLDSRPTLPSTHKPDITGEHQTRGTAERSRAQSWYLHVSIAGESYWVYPGLPYSSLHSNCSPIHQARLSSWGWQLAPSRDPAKPYLTDGAE